MEALELLSAGGPIVVTSLAVLLVTFVVRLYLNLQRKGLPPGPFAWPVVGSFPALAAGNLPHRVLQNLAVKYGGLMYLRMGSVPTIIVSTAAIAEELFRQQDGNFLDRPKLMAYQFVTNKEQQSAIACSGPYWRQMRKFYTSELFTTRRQASYQGIRTDEIKTSMKEIIADSKQGKPINIRDWIVGVTSNNMTRMLANKRYFGSGNNNVKEKEEFQFMIRSFSDMLSAFIISDYVPYLAFISRLQGWETRLKKLRVLMHGIAERVFEIQKHKQQATERADDATHVSDFVDVLLQKPFQDGQPLPDYNITLVVIDMLIAGTETIATTVEWAIAELVSHPNTMQRLQDELDTVVGSSRLIVEADFPNLPYLQAVIKETFRLHPPAVLNLPRESTQAFEFCGYRFPKQTRLIINQFAVHRDPGLVTTSHGLAAVGTGAPKLSTLDLELQLIDDGGKPEQDMGAVKACATQGNIEDQRGRLRGSAQSHPASARRHPASRLHPGEWVVFQKKSVSRKTCSHGGGGPAEFHREYYEGGRCGLRWSQGDACGWMVAQVGTPCGVMPAGGWWHKWGALRGALGGDALWGGGAWGWDAQPRSLPCILVTREDQQW